MIFPKRGEEDCGRVSRQSVSSVQSIKTRDTQTHSMTAVEKMKKECDQLFLCIDSRLISIPGQDPFDPLMVLGYNLRLMQEYVDEILSFAHEYDAPNTPAVSGFWSWVRVVSNFAIQVLASFTSRGVTATLQDQHLIRTSLILIHGLDLVIKIRVDLIAQSSAKLTPTSPSFASGNSASPPALFSPYESCYQEAILLYKQTMEDSDLGTRERILIWRTLMSLMTDRSLLPVREVMSFGSSLIHDKLFSNLPIPYIPFITSGSRSVSRTKLTVTGCEWVVNAGQKKQIYHREDYNNKTYSVNYYGKNVNNQKKVLVLYLRESWNECSRNLASDTKLPCIDVFSDYYNLFDFNESLQQLIDVYAWIHQRSAKRSLGFRPQKVIVVGHGMAGSLAVSLCVLINEIRQIRKGLPLPHCVVAVRSKFNYRLTLSASSALTFLTCMNGSLISSVNSQMQVFGVVTTRSGKEPPRRKKSFEGVMRLTKSSFPLASILMYSQQHLLDRFNLIHSLNLNVSGRLVQALVTPLRVLKNTFWDQKKQPIDLCREISLPRSRDAEEEYEEMFYECPKRVKEWNSISRRHSVVESVEYMDMSETMRQFNEIASSALISPLLYSGLKELRDIRLHLVPSNFDPALDDSVSLCRNWSGFSQMHLVEENLMDQYFDHLNAGKMLSMTKVHQVLVDILASE